MSSSPKAEVTHIAEKTASEETDSAHGIDEAALIRKVDLRLIPWLSLLYLLSFLDRTAIGNAKLYNLERDLGLSDQQYLLCLTIFFFSYAVFKVPSNILLKRLKPHFWMSFLMVGWGIMMTVQGLVHDYGGLLATRWFLGVFEAGLFPGVTYYLSCWYKRKEFGIRASLFFSAATVSGAFGGLLSAAISNMDGVGGKPGWAWIFILLGLATVIAGVFSFWIVQDFPDSAKFLTTPEREFIIKRLQGDDQFSAAGEDFNKRYIWQSLIDWKTWLGMLCYAGSDGPLYAFALFTPSVINQLGYTATLANLLSVPIYVWACILTCTVGFFGDRYGQRAIFNLVSFSIGMAGYIILLASRNAALSYFACYLAASGVYPLIPNTIAWVSNNVEGSYKRSVTLAMVVGFGNINGAVSSNIYRAIDRPWYPLGHGIVLLYIAMGWLASLAFVFLLRRENRLRDEGVRDEVIGPADDSKQGERNGQFDTLDDAKRSKGDMWSGYRYTI